MATLLLPLLLLGWAFAPAQWPHRWAWLLGALAVLTWAVVLSTGTRGTVLALATSAVLLACLGPLGRRVALGLLLTGLLGAGLSGLLFTVLPPLLLADPTTFHHPASRLTFSLSGREVIWSLAWDMIRQQPLLGVGPMHFAAHPNPIAAHPHNAPLQGAAEWGLPAALLLLAWLGRAYWQLLRRCHGAALPLAGDTHPALRMALLASLTGAATQSLVDGVLVMPTTLVWLCLLAGWAWALCERNAPLQPATWRARLWLALPFLLASLYLVWSVAQQLPYLHWPEHSGWNPIGLGLSPFPRFWSHGMIEATP